MRSMMRANGRLSNLGLLVKLELAYWACVITPLHMGCGPITTSPSGNSPRGKDFLVFCSLM
jgi:hypothetical protein